MMALEGEFVFLFWEKYIFVYICIVAPVGKLVI